MTTATLTLADFLLARIAEDEEAARTATQGAWRVSAVDDGAAGIAASAPGDQIVVMVVCSGSDGEGGCGVTDAAHIARWDPARVLAECDAKRQMIGTLFAHDDVDGLALLALPYADHPDYRGAWR